MNLTIVKKTDLETCMAITRPVLMSLCLYQSLRTTRFSAAEVFDMVGLTNGGVAVSAQSLFL